MARLQERFSHAEALYHESEAALRVINDPGRFDISGSLVTVGTRMIDAPPKVFLTVIQKDGTFRAVDRL